MDKEQQKFEFYATSFLVFVIVSFLILIAGILTIVGVF